MPFDRFGIKYFYPSKTGGWNWEQDDNPKNQDGVDWPDEMSFPSSGIVRMDPNGPTDFGLGKNIQGFSDAIGGCGMDFKETAARGYAYKKDDARDVEMKMLVKASGTGDHGFSMSACTGAHHSGGRCCQGCAYMLTTELGLNPITFEFRKEMWHVSYHPAPIGEFKHSAFNFKIEGRAKWTGLGFCRYNDPDDEDKVIVEAWGNPDPEADLNNWIMIKRYKDFNGNGWGNDGDDCGGAKDQALTWSSAQNRYKTNATNGNVTFKCVTLREIDPTGDFSTSPPSGGGPTITRKLYYGAVSSGSTTGSASYVGYGRTTSHEIVETQTDPDVGSGWWDDASGLEISDDNPAGGGQQQYPSGVWVDWYWSNSDNNNVIPGLSEVDKGSSKRMTKHNSNARLLPTPEIFLVFWGTAWRDRVTDPTMAHVVNDIQNLLLNTNKIYFSKLGQYGCGIPTWGGSCVNVTMPIPDPTENVSVTDIQNVLTDTFNRGLLPQPGSTGGTTTLTRKIVYAPSGFDTDAGEFSADNTYLPTEILIHELMNSITDPDWAKRFGPDAWYDPATGDDFMDSCGATGRQYGTGVNSYWVPGYWSNSDNSCVVPHFIETDLGSSTKMKNPSGGTPFINAKIYLVFWGTGWRDRTTDPTAAGIVDRIQNRLLGTDNAYFAKLNQYSGIQTPTWGGSAINATFAVPSGHDIPESAAKNMLINTFEKGLLPAPDNPNQNIYIIIPPSFTRIQHSGSSGTAPNGFHDIMSATMTVPTNSGSEAEDKIYLVYVPNGQSNTLVLSKSLALGWHGFNTFTLLQTPNTVPPGGGGGTGGGGGGGGTGGTPNVPVKVTGSFTVLRDLNTYRTSSCSGTSGGGGAGGSSKFFTGLPDHDKVISNTDEWDHRTRIAAKLNKTHSMKGSILKQLDVSLKKAGSPTATNKVTAVIWDATNKVVYTSPTQIDPTTLTTSFVTKSFDFSANTHPFVIGDRVGVQYTSNSSTNYVVGGYEDDPGIGAVTMVHYESGKWVEKTTRDFACVMWD